MSPSHRSLRIDAAQLPDDYVICVEGELDQAGSPALERALAEAERSQADRIVLDVDALSFIDTIGLATLVSAWHRSAASGDRLRLTRGRGDVASRFRLTRLDLTLPFTDPVSQPSA